MTPYFLYNFFHNETDDRTEKGLVKIPKDKNDWPDSWKKIDYKMYSLFKSIPLVKEDDFFLKELLSKRRSGEKYIKSNNLTLSKLSYILQCGYGLQGEISEEGREENRTIPSAGMMYPLEVYIFLFKQVDKCVSGIYHYGIKNHALEPIVYKEFSKKDILLFSPQQEWLINSNGMICVSAVFNRTIDKYGSRGYRYILLEAGHAAQNMMLAGTERGINIVAIGGTNSDVIEKVLGLSSLRERVVYTLFL